MGVGVRGVIVTDETIRWWCATLGPRSATGRAAANPDPATPGLSTRCL